MRPSLIFGRMNLDGSRYEDRTRMLSLSYGSKGLVVDGEDQTDRRRQPGGSA
ncbi:MAG: hypothetical protein OXR72_13860 [Gemmatimonadota bacterium]|nr:hypothetical protein [Gemmatimonadota bacterium]